MNTKNKFLLLVLAFITFFSLSFTDNKTQEEDFTERVKVSLRDVGNQLLLFNQDSTSLVLPIIELRKNSYQLSFQNTLSLEPNNLVIAIKTSFEKAKLFKNYRVEVIQCTNNEVAYSYEIKNTKEESIIPCAGRLLPKACYIIKVKFTNRIAYFLSKPILLLLSFSLFILLFFYWNKNKKTINIKETSNEYISIGSYQFFPTENKLVKKALEINLSKKECELLSVFVTKQNQIIKRDELMKKVWEDQGVFVGRSLDTYISKLRKKLKEDDTIKLTNIHGVGYKLEVIS